MSPKDVLCGQAKIILLVVLEIDESDHVDHRQGTERLKLRILDSDHPDGDISADTLRKRISEKLEGRFEGYEYTLEIYNPSLKEYQKLDGLSGGILQIFGSRVRVRAMPQTKQRDKLAISGRFFEFDGSMDVAGFKLTVAEDVNLPEAETAGNVWDGAILLTKALVSKAIVFEKRSRVLELGAGCGLAGLAAAVISSSRSLVLTDLPEALPRLQRNLELNRASLQKAGVAHAACTACDWFNPPDLGVLFAGQSSAESSCKADVIIVADCVWTEELVEPLFTTLCRYVSSGHTTVLISYQRRGRKTDDAFWNALGGLFVSIEEIQSSAALQIPSVFHLLVCH